MNTLPTAMDSRSIGIIVDLATDNSSSTVTQIASAVTNKWDHSGAVDTQQEQEQEQKQEDLGAQSNLEEQQQKTIQEGEVCNGNHPCVVVRLSYSQSDKPPAMPCSQTFISEDCIELLFKAKTYLDKNPGFGCEVQVVTSLLMKKFWEAACVHLFSPITTWSVWGVDIEDQAVSLREPMAVGEVQFEVKRYLETVGDPGRVNVLRSPLIPGHQFNAGFHDRYGGVSQVETMASMNMLYTIRKADPVLVVEENERRLAQAAGFDPSSMHITKAEHDRRIWIVGKEQPDRYDGIVTDQPGVTVCAAGADCCMILLADTHTGAVGAVHSGWRGTVVAAVTALLHTMMQEYGTQPVNIRASIGPSVSARHFLLPAEEAKPITNLDPTLTWPSKDNPHLVHVDLVKANAIRLQREGVPEPSIDTSHALCTFENKQFFSFERDGFPFGNQIGFISRRFTPIQHAKSQHLQRCWYNPSSSSSFYQHIETNVETDGDKNADEAICVRLPMTTLANNLRFEGLKEERAGVIKTANA
ncbi:laccase domain-containing protein 1 [Plakobranchus ocellatus]|uniref:Laccase domain-containing protein 1 n=1 Tax=Plakobranchus ocellatus TaxID=259542 RepID=A0AAV3XZW6_9GAST|nr:laccase domain-containing protein 1 [Plakobranchus ocellatus]